MILTVRLDPETERALRRLTRERGSTRSGIVRHAIARLVSEERVSEDQAPYRLIADLIGCARGGPPDLSSHTGQHFRRLLAQRATVKAKPQGRRQRKRRTMR
jgi:hypothetical protein